MAALISHQRVATQEEGDALLAQYTHTCGYTRAWRHDTDPLLIWFLPDCPADAVITALKNAMPAIVRQAYFNQVVANDPTLDARRRIIAVVNEARQLATSWLNKHTNEDISLFLQSGERLHDFILQELIAQGAVQ